MFCTNCGKQIPDDSAFCEFCGTKIDNEEISEPVKIQPQPVKQKANKSENKQSEEKQPNKLISLLVSFLLIAVAGVLVIAFAGRKGKNSHEEGDKTNEDTQSQIAQNDQNESQKDDLVEDFLKQENDSDKRIDQSESDNQDSEKEVTNEPETDILKPNGAPGFSDFSWVDVTLPDDTTRFEDIDKASGKWKCLLNAFATENVMGRIMLSEADIQHHGDKVTVYLDVTERYQYPMESPTDYELVDKDEGWVMELRGEWDASFGSIEAKSDQTELRIDINQFSENEKAQYAMGDVYNGDEKIGFIFLVRP